MDSLVESAQPDINGSINKNFDIISKMPKIQAKHIVIEIVEGQFLMNELSCNDLLQKVRESYDINQTNYNGSISYRDCKMMLSEIEYVHNIDTRFECLLNSILVIVNDTIKMDAFIKELCQITNLYSNKSKETFDNNLDTKTNKSPSRFDTSFLKLEEQSTNFKHPFEVCVLECCFKTAISHLESDLISFEDKYKILEDKMYNNKKLKDISILLHELKHPVSNLSVISKGFEELVNEILDSEENLKILEFSNHVYYYGNETLKNNLSFLKPNRELQFLVEYFDQEIDQICKRTRRLDNSLLHLERYINLELSITRNEMMRLEVMCSILGVSFGVGAVLSGLFGMNVINSFENNRYAFIVITIAFLIVLSVSIYITRVLQVKHRV